MIRRLCRGTLVLVIVAQVCTAVRVVLRLAFTASGTRITETSDHDNAAGPVTVLVPVLNEEDRLGPCLTGLSEQYAGVVEILVIDGGSADATRTIVDAATRNDSRVRWIDASPVPAGWNGKAWGLQAGFAERDPRSGWVLTIDADVRPGRDLVTSLLAHARREQLDAFSVATMQRLSGAAESVVHPALLATLVYRYGIPGHAESVPDAVQANGQCLLVRAGLLERIDGFRSGRDAISEDVTIAREIARHDVPVGFFEIDQHSDLIEVEMYASAREAWGNWTRSLPMRDRQSGIEWWLRMVDMTLTIGFPLPIILASALARRSGHGCRSPLDLLLRLNLGLLAMRVGVTGGMRRAYQQPPPTYWLSIVADPAVVAKLWSTAVRRDHQWRGRPIRRG